MQSSPDARSCTQECSLCWGASCMLVSTSRFTRVFLNVFFFSLSLSHVQVIGALVGLTGALEDDVRAGLRTDSRRCVALLRVHSMPTRFLPEVCQPGKHRCHYRSWDGALELHLRTACFQTVRQTGLLSPRLDLYVFSSQPSYFPTFARAPGPLLDRFGRYDGSRTRILVIYVCI